jgi:protein transport protein SEC61 subunit gamma-like protein
MDLNEGSKEKKDEASQNSQPQPEIKAEEQKPKLQFANPKLQQILEGKQKFYMPKLKMPNFKEKFAEYGRVLKVTKKPDSEEFKAIVKASGLGIIVIGMVGFIIAMIVQLIQMI